MKTGIGNLYGLMIFLGVHISLLLLLSPFSSPINSSVHISSLTILVLSFRQYDETIWKERMLR